MIAYEMIEHASLNELKEHLNQSGLKTLLLGEHHECVRKYYSFRLLLVHPVVLGVCSSFHGIAPSIVVGAQQDILLVGWDSNIAWVDITSMKNVSSTDLVSPFNQFIEVSSDRIVAIFEIDVIMIDFNGNILWRYDFRDIITDVKFDGQKTLTVKLCENEKTVRINCANGSVA